MQLNKETEIEIMSCLVLLKPIRHLESPVICHIHNLQMFWDLFKTVLKMHVVQQRIMV